MGNSCIALAFLCYALDSSPFFSFFYQISICFELGLPLHISGLGLVKGSCLAALNTRHYLATAWPQFCQCNFKLMISWLYQMCETANLKVSTLCAGLNHLVRKGNVICTLTLKFNTSLSLCKCRIHENWSDKMYEEFY